MPFKKSAVPKLRHYKPKNLAVVRIDGKDHYLGNYGSPESIEKYHRLLAERAASPLMNPVVGSGTAQATVNDDPTVDQIVLAFWDHAQVHYRHADGTPTAELDNLKHSTRPLRSLYGSTKAKDFGPKSLKAVRQTMLDSGLARTTINHRIGKIIRIFRFAVENELVPASIHHALKSVSGLQKGRTKAPEPQPVRPVADADVDAIRPFVTRQVWAMVELQRLTGARPGEVVILRTGDLDRTGETWIYRPSRHKTEHHGFERRIVFGPKAREVVEPWLRDDPDAFVFQPREAVESRNVNRRASRQTPMTPSQKARRPKAKPDRPPGLFYSKNAYRTAIWRACDRAFRHPTLGGIKKTDLTPVQLAELSAWRKAHRWHPNQLRHSAATAIRAKFGLEAAQAVLGHAKADVTQIYAERDLAKARTVMAEVG